MLTQSAQSVVDCDNDGTEQSKHTTVIQAASSHFKRTAMDVDDYRQQLIG